MLFEKFYNAEFKNKTVTILAVSYGLIMLILYLSFYVSARHNASLYIRNELQKKLDEFLMSSDAAYNDKSSYIDALVESNSLIMPLSMRLTSQINELIAVQLRRGKTGLNSIKIIDKNKNVIFDNSGLLKDTAFLSISDRPYNCYVYQNSLLRVKYAPVFYRGPDTDEKAEIIGAVIAAYDFFGLDSSVPVSTWDNSFTLYGYAGGKFGTIYGSNEAGYTGSMVNPYSLDKFTEGFSSLIIDGKKTPVLNRHIKLENSDKPFIVSIAMSQTGQHKVENGYIFTGLINCTLTSILITFVFGLAYFTVKYYLNKEISNRLEIQNLRVQRHDFSKHLSLIAGMAAAKEYKELEAYLESLGKKVVFEGDLAKLDNPALNVLIQEKELEARENGIDFRISVKTSLMNSPADPTDLCIIMANLIDNAIEAALCVEHPSKMVSVEFGQIDGLHTFMVSNTGFPIPEEQLEKIFRPGYSTKPDKSGRGMGLYIVNRILRKYKGSIEVESNEKSTVFTVYMPYRKK